MRRLRILLLYQCSWQCRVQSSQRYDRQCLPSRVICERPSARKTLVMSHEPDRVVLRSRSRLALEVLFGPFASSISRWRLEDRRMRKPYACLFLLEERQATNPTSSNAESALHLSSQERCSCSRLVRLERQSLRVLCHMVASSHRTVEWLGRPCRCSPLLQYRWLLPVFDDRSSPLI